LANVLSWCSFWILAFMVSTSHTDGQPEG
jgi:hypothetical protein